MTQPNTQKKHQQLTAAALIAAATAETIRHNTKLNPGWSPPSTSDDLRQPIGEYVVEAHDLRRVAPAMDEAQARELAPVWELDPDLRRGAKPIFRRAIEGVIAHADRGMRQHGWSQVARDTGHTHHGGATWSRNGDQVTLQACVQSRLPASLLEYAPSKTGRKIEDLGYLRWPVGGTRIHLVIQPHDADRPAGYHRLTECLANALWRLEDTRENRPPAADDIALTEVRARDIRWVGELGEVYFRRENEGGMLPEALRTQLHELRGKVVFHEICTPRLDSLKVSQGCLMRPDGQWITISYEKVACDDFGLPDLEPGEIELVHPSLCLGRRGKPKTTRVGADKAIPEADLGELMRPSKWHAANTISDAVRHSVRWEMEDGGGSRESGKQEAGRGKGG